VGREPPGQEPPGSGGGDREQFRSPGAIALSWVWLAAALLVIIDVAVQSRDRSGLTIAMVAVAVTGVVYGCAWRPRVVADAGGITIVNPLRDHRVPWGSVASVDAASALRVHCAPPEGEVRGKVLSSWAVQSTPRTGMRARRQQQPRTGGRRPGMPGGRPGMPGGRPGAPGGYGQPREPEPRLADSSAESTAARLEERAQQARRAGASGGQPTARWAWGPIAVMVVPIVAFVVILLT
jgi:PH (Pleckstrin Homology) domain-containing protein